VGAFGEKLRKQREQRGIELDAISNTTKIGTRMLRALEEEHFDQLPGGVFNKGFVRAYARHVGLDEEEAVADYLAALRENQIQAGQIMPNLRGKPGNSSEIGVETFRAEAAPRVGNSRSSQPAAAPAVGDTPPAERFTKKYPAGIVAETSGESSREVPWAKLTAVVLLVILALAFWAFRHRRKVSAAGQTVSSSQETSHVETSSVEQTGEKTIASAPVSAALSKPAPLAAAATAAPNTSSSAAPSPAPSPDGTPKPAANNPSADIPLTATQHKTQAAAESAPMLRLQIRATETSWVSIIADGNPLAHETLIAPASTSVRATREIVVRTGNAAGLSFFLNGKEIPAQGGEGEVKTYTFDAHGLREPTP
jgi:hypothetical protein